MWESVPHSELVGFFVASWLNKGETKNKQGYWGKAWGAGAVLTKY